MSDVGDKTGIEWTDATWNPTTGCDQVSPGCDHCYALTQAKRLKAMGQPDYQTDGRPETSGPGFGLAMHPHRLDQPLRWTKPRRVFVNSMSDLFHPRVSDEFIARVWAVMALAEQHTFQVLTKRPKRMRALLSSNAFTDAVIDIAADHPLLDQRAARGQWPLTGWDATFPLPNVWLGTSVEDQTRANDRVPVLLDTPAAVRFLSCEPLLGPVELMFSRCAEHDFPGGFCISCPNRQRLDWVIVGGESGKDARPMQPDWARSLRDQCATAGVAFHFKQWGEWAPTTRHGIGVLSDPREAYGEHVFDSKYTEFKWRRILRRVGKKAAGRELDGRTWDEYPAEAGDPRG